MKRRIIIEINNILIAVTTMFSIILLVSDISKITLEIVLIKIISMIYIGVIWNNNKDIILNGGNKNDRKN